MSSCNRGEIIRALGRMASGAEERGHYSFSRLDAAWVREAIDMLCSDHEQLELRIADSATAWNKCEERRKNEEKLQSALKNIALDPYQRGNPQVFHNEWEEFSLQLVGYAREALGAPMLSSHHLSGE